MPLPSVVATEVFGWNKENVFDIPLKLFFINVAVAWDDDENREDDPLEFITLPLVVVVDVAVIEFLNEKWKIIIYLIRNDHKCKRWDQWPYP